MYTLRLVFMATIPLLGLIQITEISTYLSRKFLIRTNCKRILSFKEMKLRHATDSGRLFRWKQFLTYYDYTIEWIAGDNNYLLDALTREMTMFTRKPRADKGNAKEQSLEEAVKAYMVIPKGITITNDAQRNSMAILVQTTTGKGTSNPFKDVALLKSKEVSSNGFNELHGNKTQKRLEFKQKNSLDNLLYSFQTTNQSLLFKTLYALTEEIGKTSHTPRQKIVKSPFF